MTSNSSNSKAMLSGCVVCSDERGWSENPLVYCDGLHCSVAVHLACYGIKKEDLKDNVDWFCRICQSQERHVKVKCELCPSREGAFKMTDNNTWAHVICSLYIPEVRFGDVTTMEPIILSSIPMDRYNKTCYICDERGKENKSKMGACMQCNKQNCNKYFHVTCAQAAGLLCEEAGNNDDNVKYCGYCKYHVQKVRKDHNVKLIPAFKPVNQTEQSEPSLGKKSRHHHNTDTSKPPKKKQKFYSSSSQRDSDNESKREKMKTKRKRTSSTSKEQSSNSYKHNSSKESNNSIIDDSLSDDSIIFPPSKKSKENKEIKKIIYDSNTDDDEDEILINKKNSSNSSNKSDLERKKIKKTSSKNKETDKATKEKKIKKKKDESNSNKKDKEDSNLNKINKINKLNEDKPISNKINQNEIVDKQIYKSMSPKNSSISFSNKNEDLEDDEEDDDDDKIGKEIAIRNELPKKNFNLPELVKHKSILDEEKKTQQKEHKTLEDLLEHTWNQTSQFVMEQQNQYIGSLISCLYELNSENVKLEEKVKNLITKKDHLVAVNSRLSIPLTTNAISTNNNLDNWENSNQSSIANTLTNNLTETPTANLFHSTLLNQQQQNFTSSIHNTTTSTPSPQQHKQQNNHTNYFNHVNNSLSNQNFNNKSLDLHSNLSNSFVESLHNQSSNQSSTSTNLNKPSSSSSSTANNNNLSYNLLQAAVNGQFNLNNSSNTSSPSSKFNNQFNNLTGNTNSLLPAQIFQTLFQNSQYQSIPNNSVLNGNQNKR